MAYFWNRKSDKYPPGPGRLPIVGSAPYLGKHIHLDVTRMVEKYNSDVIGLQLGTLNAVVINGYEKVKETFTNSNLCVDRSQEFFLAIISGRKGLTHVNGKVWQEQRRHALTVLRNFGMGKMVAEQRVQNEIAYLLEVIDDKQGLDFDPQDMLAVSVSNIICAVVFGKRYEYDDEDFKSILTTLNNNVKLFNYGSVLFLFPSLRHIPGNMFGYKEYEDNLNCLLELVQKHIDEHKRKFNSSSINDFIDAYLAEIERLDSLHEDHSFKDSQMTAVIRDLFFGGSENTSTTLRWSLAILVNYPDIQTRVQKEIDENIGQDRLPQMKDRLNMPYTNAVIMEIQRFASITPLGFPHANSTRDITLYGYDIPKETLIFPNLYGINHDPNIWPYPNDFDPRNFIDEHGNQRNHEYMVSFSIGKRDCPGESLARMEIFLMVVSILQRFCVVPSEKDGLPGLDGTPGAIRMPEPYTIRLQRRCQNETL